MECIQGVAVKKIFLSIAAQDDEELKNTLTSAFENADNPERVFVGVFLSAMHKKTKKELTNLAKQNKNIRFTLVKQRKNNLKTLGIGKGRRGAADLYLDEDYMIQIDCHSYFDKSWDTYLISLFEEAISFVGDDKLVLTGIPPVYRYCCTDHNMPLKTERKTRYPFYMTSSFFVNTVPRWMDIDIIKNKKEKFIPVVKASPAFIIGNKKFANNPGIHKKAIFYDEDLTQSINLFGNGFAFAFPNIEDLPISHLDSDGIIEGHERYFFLDYLNKENNYLIHEQLKEEYKNFIKDPNNSDNVEKYYKYSKVHPLKGCFSLEHDVVPKRFRLEQS